MHFGKKMERCKTKEGRTSCHFHWGELYTQALKDPNKSCALTQIQPVTTSRKSPGPSSVAERPAPPAALSVTPPCAWSSGDRDSFSPAISPLLFLRPVQASLRNQSAILKPKAKLCLCPAVTLLQHFVHHSLSLSNQGPAFTGGLPGSLLHSPVSSGSRVWSI